MGQAKLRGTFEQRKASAQAKKSKILEKTKMDEGKNQTHKKMSLEMFMWIMASRINR